MLRNYLATALRNLVKHRLYSAINIGGLALGLAACLVILLFVRDELSYDEWLPNAERIAKLEVTFAVPGREPLAFSQAPGPAKAAMEKEFSSDVEKAVRIFRTEQPVRLGDRQFIEQVNYVDPTFFDVFDLPIAEGEREPALASNSTVLLSRRAAEKYFGDQPAIGKVITVDNELDLRVAGVFADLPANTHLELDLIARLDPQRYTDRPSVLETWTSANVHLYVLFRSAEAIARVEAELPGLIKRNVVLDIPGFKDADLSKMLLLDLLPVLDIHLRGRKTGHFRPGGDIAAVYAFSAIAALILVIACINFVNLATARSMKRAREVAVRKVVGATRRQIIAQHLGEAVLTACVSLCLALALVELALPAFNAFLHKQLSFDFADPTQLGLALGLVGVVGLLGGLYPAIYLSHFRPARVLKANQSSASGSPRFRNALVVFQFAISIGLIVCTAVVYVQTIYARTMDLGFDAEGRVVVQALSDLPSGELRETLKKEVSALPGVRKAALSSDAPPLRGMENTLLFRTAVPGNDRLLIETQVVDVDYFDVYGVLPLAGRLFSREFPADVRVQPDDKRTEPTESVVVNEAVLRRLGVARAQDAIGMTVWEPIEISERSPTPDRLARVTIIGVISDLQLRSARTEIAPFLYYLQDGHRGFSYLTVAIEPGRVAEVQRGITAIWQRLAPTVPIRMSFMDDDIAAQYDADEQRAQTFAAFAVFAVLIACLGLFGLASFAAERRTKEIGLRKVLGASVFDIVRLLVWQFSRPVLIANLIAWPAAFLFTRHWLAGFRYAIDLTSPLVLIGLFGGAGLVGVAIAWSTVAGHATRVARASPIHALRCE
jgi:putative ABC transport system permease protein